MGISDKAKILRAFKDSEELITNIQEALVLIQESDEASDEDLRSVADYIRDPRVVEPLIRVRSRIIHRNKADGPIEEIYNDLSTLQVVLEVLEDLYYKIREKKRKK